MGSKPIGFSAVSSSEDSQLSTRGKAQTQSSPPSRRDQCALYWPETAVPQ